MHGWGTHNVISRRGLIGTFRIRKDLDVLGPIPIMFYRIKESPPPQRS